MAIPLTTNSLTKHAVSGSSTVDVSTKTARHSNHISSGTFPTTMSSLRSSWSDSNTNACPLSQTRLIDAYMLASASAHSFSYHHWRGNTVSSHFYI